MATISIDSSDFRHAASELEDHKWKALAGQTVGATLRQSGNIVRRHVRQAAAPHRRTGRMAGHVIVTNKGAGVDTVVTVHAGGKIAHLIEGGTREHMITAGAGRGQLGGGGKALTIRGAGASSGSLAGFGNKSVRGAGSDVLALRRSVHIRAHPADPFFERGVKAAEPEVQARTDKGAQTMRNNLAFRLNGRK